MDQNDHSKQPYALKPGEGWVYHWGTDFTVKASELREGSSTAFMEYVARKGDEPDDHTHETEDEMFYVLEGSITFRCAGKTFDLTPGGFVFLPRGLKHGYTIHGDEPVRLLVVTSLVRAETGRGWGGFVGDLENGQGELVAKPALE